MIHLGDITKINGAEIEPVDCITAGSPCQDLSVAGKRAGLEGERSGLFMEQIRIIKEMREHDRTTGRTGKFVRPRYMVWENVPGALSSNKGEDFRCVLEETARIVKEDAVIPQPDGKWSSSGCIMGDGWSIAWRVHDAQFWGVPQRRKRIALVADFAGHSAGEILFERTSVSGDITESGKEGQGVASDVGSGTQETGRAISFQERAGKPGGGKGILIQDEHVGALSTLNNQMVCIEGNGSRDSHKGDGYKESETMYTLNTVEQHAVCYGISSYDSNAMKSPNPNSGIYKADKSRTLDLNGGNPACNQGGLMVVQRRFSNVNVSQEDIAPTLEAGAGEGGNNMPIVFDSSRRHDYKPMGEICETVQAHYGTGGNNVPIVLEDNESKQKLSNVFMDAYQHHGYRENDTCGTLTRDQNQGIRGDTPLIVRSTCYTKINYGDYKEGVGTLRASGGDLGGGSETLMIYPYVRRLTPMECERLQGFPDNWTNIGEWIDSKGKKHKDADSPRYKALGNSIALPFWFYLLRRISAQYERPATLGSLFDGIGGFPLCWERCNGAGTARWASEIEEFPIAVTKYWFEEGNEKWR